ncbi:AraC family transcriptional regulator [Bacillaceae bacterium SIJ1]|uniref:helix-turn-helix domain-containing protein n=1 Tax=Litoribacterium kuwaitense TaxID=1398745 RepID=UPI0013EC443A|nr:AraC family transcriptional regulator [Litoribacterium kuwaitense]NGP46432.1 AraC family transcriptional regulator [Litoribacterium kuwaitense]
MKPKGTAVIAIYESKHNEKDVVKSHHHSSHQLLYNLEGEGVCTLDYEEYPITPDSFIIIPPFTEHSISSKSKTTILVLEFDVRDYSEDVQQRLIAKVFQKGVVQQVSMFEGSELRQLLRKMLYEQSNANDLWEIALKVYMTELLFIIARSQQEVKYADTNTLRVERIKQYIETHYFDIKSAEDIASKLGVSKRYIQSIYKEHYGCTPMQYLTDVRLGVVKKLLLETDKDIVSICFEVGFESLATYYRLFKKQTGVPPKMYRKTYQGRVDERP